jgi:cobalt-zinc-cadmium efflux system membrane fusion protein
VPPGSPLRDRLKVTAALKESLRRELLAPASVEAEPARLAKISPPLPGRVVKLFVHFGDTVKQGQALFAMDSPELVAAQSDFLKARSAFTLAERNVARQKDLVEHGIGAARESELAQAECDTARSELDRATMRLRLLGIDPGKVGAPLTVTSPLEGRVIDLATAPGQFQNDPAVVLMTVADLTSVWVTADVQEKDIRRVGSGDEALVAFTAYPGETFTGSVLFVGDLLNAETRTIKVRVALPNRDLRLKPGMFATVTFKSKAADEVVVPTTAVVLSGERSTVYVETSDWTFEKRVVEVGDQIGGNIVVTRGLDVGTRVVSSNAVLLP